MNDEHIPACLVDEFHRCFGLPRRHTPCLPSDISEITLYRTLLLEEAAEFASAADSNDLVGVADALADIVYVAYGAAAQFGLDLDVILHEVHRSNMTKLDVDGPVRRIDGKVLRGTRYEPPRIAQIISDMQAGRT